MEHHLIKVAHLRHCIDYKKTVFRCIFTALPLPEELEKYIFPFIGVFPLFYDALSYTVSGPEPWPSSGSWPLHRFVQDPLQNTTNET